MRVRCPLAAAWLPALVAALLLSLAAAAPAGASERHPTLVELEGEIMCPTCHTTLDQSNSLEAQRIEAFISRRIAAGATKSEIKNELVAQFGEAILAAPPRRGWDLLVWWLPIAGAAGGGAVLALAGRHWSRKRPIAAAQEAEPPLDERIERRIDEELARF